MNMHSRNICGDRAGRYLNGFVKIAVWEPKTVGHRLESKKSASSTVQPSFFHLERSAVGNIL